MERLHTGGAKRAGGFIGACVAEATTDLLHIGRRNAVKPHCTIVTPLIKELAGRALWVLSLIGSTGADKAITPVGIGADGIAALLPCSTALTTVPVTASGSAEPCCLTKAFRYLCAAALIGAARIDHPWITGSLTDREVANQAWSTTLRPPLVVHTGLSRFSLGGRGAEGRVAHEVAVGVERIWAGLVKGAALPRLAAPNMGTKAHNMSTEETWSTSLGTEARIAGVPWEISVRGVGEPSPIYREAPIWKRGQIWA